MAVGISSCSSCTRFGPNSSEKTVTPVRLPPGRFKLLTSPASTGSVSVKNTIGMVVVAALAGGECCRRTARRSDHRHLTTDQIGYQCGDSIVLPFGPAIFGLHIASLDISYFAQALVERA